MPTAHGSKSDAESVDNEHLDDGVVVEDGNLARN
jgi:hypothetical protein